jgi:hypothetical protein
MQLEPWYYLKETNGVLEDNEVHKANMYRDRGSIQYMDPCPEDYTFSFIAVCDFPYKLYPKESEAKEKLRKLRWTSDNYHPTKNMKYDELGGYREQTLDNKLTSLIEEEEDDL